MKKFEYIVIDELVVGDHESVLNEWGDFGWELVAVSSSRLYMKREIE